MIRFYLLTLTILIGLKLNAQVEEHKVAEGADNRQVTDIVVVFKMHVDIGYASASV